MAKYYFLSKLAQQPNLLMALVGALLTVGVPVFLAFVSLKGFSFSKTESAEDAEREMKTFLITVGVLMLVNACVMMYEGDSLWYVVVFCATIFTLAKKVLAVPTGRACGVMGLAFLYSVLAELIYYSIIN